jgi:hypothetical protein
MIERQARTALHLQLSDACLKSLKERAAKQGSDLGEYADMIFHYLIRERVAASALAEGSEAAVYFSVEIPAGTKCRLAELAERRQISLAVFSGMLVGHFMGQFEHDPRDFSMVHYLSTVLLHKTNLAEADLRIALGRLGAISEQALPPGYYQRWLFSRMRSLVSTIEKDGQVISFTAQNLEDLLKTHSRCESEEV